MVLDLAREDVDAEVADWLKEHADEVRDAYSETDSSFVAESLAAEVPWLRLLWDAGWTRYGWPEFVGGLGGGPALRATIYDAFWSRGFVLPERISALEVLAPALIEYAPEIASEEIALYLTGVRMWAQCFSEPEAGSDMASIRTTATQVDDGYVLSGQKIWSSYGHVSQRAVVLARTGPQDSAHRGLSMFWVDLNTAGISCRSIKQASGRDEFSEVFFDNAFVPTSQRVGGLDQGWAVAMYVLQYERGMFSWWRQLVMNCRLEKLLSSVDVGIELIGGLADTYRLLSLLRSRSGSTVLALDTGQKVGPRTSIDKILLSTAERALADLCRNAVFPRLELAIDGEADRLREQWFHSRAVSIYGGALEIHYDIVADHLLAMPKEPKHGR